MIIAKQPVKHRTVPNDRMIRPQKSMVPRLGNPASAGWEAMEGAPHSGYNPALPTRPRSAAATVD